MDLEKAWQNWQTEAQQGPVLTEIEIRQAIRAASQTPLAGVQRAMQRRLYWTLSALVFVFCMLVLSWDSPARSSLALAFFSIFVGALGLAAWQVYRLKHSALRLDQDLRSTLQQHIQVAENAIWLDELSALFLYPVSLCLGYFYGLLLYGLSWSSILQRGDLILLLLAMVILISPPLLFWTRQANQRSFGLYLQLLKENLGELEL
jgi:hypothetical protein